MKSLFQRRQLAGGSHGHDARGRGNGLLLARVLLGRGLALRDATCRVSCVLACGAAASCSCRRPARQCRSGWRDPRGRRGGAAAPLPARAPRGRDAPPAPARRPAGIPRRRATCRARPTPSRRDVLQKRVLLRPAGSGCPDPRPAASPPCGTSSPAPSSGPQLATAALRPASSPSKTTTTSVAAPLRGTWRGRHGERRPQRRRAAPRMPTFASARTSV